MNEFLSRFAKPGTLTLALIVVALAFAFYLAVMACVAPLPAIVRKRGRFGGSHWLALALAAVYAGNGIYVGRSQTVLMLAIGGVVVGLLVGVALARQQEPVPQA
jgi:Na+/H+ antiporter NhaD/arsenite permease-like protein